MANNKKYELIFLISPKMAADKSEVIFSSLKEQIKNIGGKINQQEEMGVRKLAYEIDDKKEAAFFVWQIEFDKSPKISSLNLFINREAGIMRYLFLMQ